MDASSSYTKVYKLLINTPEGLALEQELVKAIDSAHVAGVSFQLHQGEKHPEAAPSFKIIFGKADFGAGGNIEQINLNAGTIIDGKNCSVIVDKRFGKHKPGGVSTFNCSSDTVKSGAWRTRGRIYSFSSWASEHFQGKYQAKLTEAGERLKAQVVAMSHSDEFKVAKHEALRNYAIEAIVTVMDQYAWLGKEVLKDALDSYICHAVIDC